MRARVPGRCDAISRMRRARPLLRLRFVNLLKGSLTRYAPRIPKSRRREVYNRRRETPRVRPPRLLLSNSRFQGERGTTKFRFIGRRRTRSFRGAGFGRASRVARLARVCRVRTTPKLTFLTRKLTRVQFPTLPNVAKLGFRHIYDNEIAGAICS